MAFHLRKLLTEFVIPSCCADIKNPYASCPIECYNFCPPCDPHIIDPPPLLPPLQPPPPYIPSFNSSPDKPHKLYLLLAISLSILATIFFIFICYTIYKFYSRLYNSRPRQSHQSGPDDFLDEEIGPAVDHHVWYIRTVGLQPSVISAITIVKYKKGDGLVEGTDCSVCLSEFEENETLRLLPKCNHAFHIPCIDTWLRSHTNCPMCRAGIVNNTADSSPQLLIVQNSGLDQETRLEDTRDSENESSELRIGIEEEGVSRSQRRLKINGELDGVQPMRRSVSVDSLSASAIANAFSGQSDGNSDNQPVDLKASTVEDTAGKAETNQTGSSSMKRSVSCNAKVLLSRHTSRNRNQ